MSDELLIVLYFNLCAITLAGWLTTRERAANSKGWRILSLMSAIAFVCLFSIGAPICLLALLIKITVHGF